MAKKNYDLTQITRVLLEMRDNCVPKDGEAYDDPKRMEKYDALNLAIDLINNPSLLVTGYTSDRWNKTKEKLPEKSGMYLVIYRFDPLPGEECGLYVDCAEWMRKGDHYTPDPLPQDDRSEYKRLIALLTGEYDKEVEEDGFYEQDGDTLYPLNVEFWSELPMTPEGRAANAPEV